MSTSVKRRLFLIIGVLCLVTMGGGGYLYARALANEIAAFTGISDPYEEPDDPDLRLDTLVHRPTDSAELVVEQLEKLGLVSLAAVRSPS